MAQHTIIENIHRNTEDWFAVKAAVRGKGVDCPDDTPTADVAGKIEDIEAGDSVLAKKLIERKSNFTTLELPDGITQIGSYGLAYITSVDSVTIPDSVTTLCDHAFYNSRFSSIVMNGKISTINEQAFERCTQLTQIDLTGVRLIEPAAFVLCRSLTSVVIPESIEDIRYSSFQSCTALAEVEFRGSYHSISDYLFDGCTALSRIVFPTGVNYIGEGAFNGCTSLTAITIPSTVTRIGRTAFARCVSLKTVYLPSSLTTIGNDIFSGCSNLEFVTLENGFNANNLILNSSTLFSAATIVSWLNALADRTGRTAYTLYIGTTNLNKLTNEEIAIATNKNWNLA